MTDEFAAARIDGHTGEVVTEVARRRGPLRGRQRRAPFDHLIAFPPYVAAVRYEALPSDERGFLETELPPGRLYGHPDIYAPGDAGDFPVKQAFLAFLQADTVAEHIGADLGPTRLRGALRPGVACA